MTNPTCPECGRPEDEAPPSFSWYLSSVGASRCPECGAPQGADLVHRAEVERLRAEARAEVAALRAELGLQARFIAQLEMQIRVTNNAYREQVAAWRELLKGDEGEAKARPLSRLRGSMRSDVRLSIDELNDAIVNTDVEASGLVMLGVCSVKGPSCTAPMTAAPITVVVEVETKNQIPVCRACFKERVSDGDWYSSWTRKATKETP